MHKDIRLALAAGDELNTPLPAAGAADQRGTFAAVVAAFALVDTPLLEPAPAIA